LCGKAGTRDIVDATVVAVALSYGALVFTSDPEDITHLAAATDVKPGLVVRRLQRHSVRFRLAGGGPTVAP